jgi:hypothetical protein
MEPDPKTVSVKQIWTELPHLVKVLQVKWYYWHECGIWKTDTKDLVTMKRLSGDIADDIRNEAEATRDGDRKQKLLQWAETSESSSPLKSVFEIVKSEPELIVEADQLDAVRG